jgi:hypothetical protein
MIVRGVVNDTVGSPIDLVNILVVGSNPQRGTVTDFNGNFAIDVPENSILEFSHVGTKQKIQSNVGKRNFIEIVMMNELQLPSVDIIGTKKKSCWWCWLIPITIGVGIAYSNSGKKGAVKAKI